MTEQRQADHEQLLIEDAGLLQRLRKLIGQECEYLGKPCRLVEILTDEAILILKTREQLPPIQTNQYGQALFRGDDLIQVPIFGRDRNQFSDELIDLLVHLTSVSTAASGPTPLDAE